MKTNKHLPKNAYLDDQQTIEAIVDEIADAVEARLEDDAEVSLDFFYDERDETYGVETYVNGELYDLSHGRTILEAIQAAVAHGAHEGLENNPPTWVADEATWKRAKAHVEPYWDEYEEPWAVVSYVYKQMGGKTK